MARRLAGKVAIVTGGNAGIGEAAVRLFAEEGARVAIMARREEEGRSVEGDVRKAGGDATFIRCDVTDLESVRAAVNATIERYGALHVLFNNAGGAFPGEFPHESGEVWEHTIRLNLTSTFWMTRACWDHIVRSGGGAVVNMSSVAAVTGMSPAMRDLIPGVPPAAYAAAKAGVEAFTRYAAGPGGRVNIRVNCVRPGLIATAATAMPGGEGLIFDALFEQTQITPGPGDPMDIANAALFLACDESRFINGQVITIDGGAAQKL
jgi:NAD(P)-dependent dehydrogenase (short-subunit alcohol dehydrogenase family)